MPVITRERQKDQITVQNGDLLMQSLQEAGIPVASSCGGEAVCAKCVIRIVAGAENLSPPTPDEDFLRDLHDFPADVRVSCQAKVLGDVTVDAKYW